MKLIKKSHGGVSVLCPFCFSWQKENMHWLFIQSPALNLLEELAAEN